MDRPAILCVTDDASARDSLEYALQDAGYEPLITSSAAQATALFFVRRNIEAVVLDQRGKEQISLGLARIMRSLRADVPILVLAANVLDPLPRCLDACVCLGQEPASLLPALRTLVRGRVNMDADLYGARS